MNLRSSRVQARPEGTPPAMSSVDETEDGDLQPMPGASPAQVDREVIEGAASPPAGLPEGWTPSSRMEDVRTRASGYEREYRLRLIHRMLMRNMPLDQIAQQLSISVSTVKNERRELHRRLKEAAQKLDINHLLGDTLGYYAEVTGMALRIATSSDTPLNLRLAALRTSLSAKGDMARFLSAAGVFDSFKYTGDNDDTQAQLVETISQIKDLLADTSGMESDLENMDRSQLSPDELFDHDVGRVIEDDDVQMW